MTSVETLKRQRTEALSATAGGPPARTSNPFFGVGPITDGVADEAEGRLLRFEFEAWLEQRYRKLDDKGRDLGPFTAAEIGRSMHRGYPADKVLLDMMQEIHRYFGFPKNNRMAVGLGGGHSGFTVCILHLVAASDQTQHILVDTPRPESPEAQSGGFFRQSWGSQLLELMRFAQGADVGRIHFSGQEGVVPSADRLEEMGIKLFIGVGHETTGATTYSEEDIAHLLDWLDRNPAEHHAVLDATSMLGAMPWRQELVEGVMAKCCLFMPFQKAIGGISGYFVVSFTPQALQCVESNQKCPGWAIPRQLKLAVPVDPRRPLSGERTVGLGPFYDPAQGRMLSGVINTFSTLAFAETTFGLLRTERRLGSVTQLNARSRANREIIDKWVAANPLFRLGVEDPARRGAAVTLLKVDDPEIPDPEVRARIIARSKQLLGYEGITHPNGEHEPGLDVARYVNAFPGTPGDYRAWIGGIRAPEDIHALLDNLKYAYHRAKAVVLEEQLAELGHSFEITEAETGRRRCDDPSRAYKVLILDLVGLKLDEGRQPDHSEVRQYIEARGGEFHNSSFSKGTKLAKGRIHFFYLPHLCTEKEILAETSDGRYDAVIAAATIIPRDSVFPLGGVRIGAGTGNMGSASWGGGNGEGGSAPLMNTPSFNSRATAQFVMKALLRVLPQIPLETLHQLSVSGDFDTGKDLRKYPTEKLEGKTIAILGYGNIGREVAKLAHAFGMKVRVHARPRHRQWIESEGFAFAATPQDAASGADVLSPHTGLGALNTVTGKYANAHVIDQSVLAAMNDGAVLINFDRGEVVDVAALDAAMASGKIRFAAVDADIFLNSTEGPPTGPLAPYLALDRKYPGRTLLLPHVAADTDHVSRVEGAKQAVDQIFDVIQFKSVTNLKGTLPAGYVQGAPKTIPGIGAVRPHLIFEFARKSDQLHKARTASEKMAAIWGALSACTDDQRRQALLDRHAATLVSCVNDYKRLMEKFGIEGPYC